MYFSMYCTQFKPIKHPATCISACTAHNPNQLNDQPQVLQHVLQTIQTNLTTSHMYFSMYRTQFKPINHTAPCTSACTEHSSNQLIPKSIHPKNIWALTPNSLLIYQSIRADFSPSQTYIWCFSKPLLSQDLA